MRRMMEDRFHESALPGRAGFERPARLEPALAGRAKRLFHGRLRNSECDEVM